MSKLKPALLGGLITGILSVIPFVSACCCIWAILGGLLACFLYVRSAPAPVTTGEGAMVGALSGVVGAIIYLVIQLPLMFFFGMAQMEEAVRRTGVELPVTGMALALLSIVIMMIILLVCSIIGGLIGVPIFEKRKGAIPPPPPVM